MTTKRSAPTRMSGTTHLWLLKLVGRLKSNRPLSHADRQAAALLLSQVADDQDVRDHFFTTLAKRPRANDPRAWDAAWVFLYRVKFDREKSGKALRGKVSGLSGLTDAQVDHAVREHRHTIKLALEAFGPELSRAKAAECMARLRQREK